MKAIKCNKAIDINNTHYYIKDLDNFVDILNHELPEIGQILDEMFKQIEEETEEMKNMYEETRETTRGRILRNCDGIRNKTDDIYDKIKERMTKETKKEIIDLLDKIDKDVSFIEDEVS